jgi:phospholipase A1/A2
MDLNEWEVPRRSKGLAFLVVAIGCAAPPVWAQLAATPQVRAAAPAASAAPDLRADLQTCERIADDQRRLICYDRLARGERPAAPAAASASAAENDALIDPDRSAAARAAQPSPLARFWELEEEDKRGTFRFFTYHPNFLLPVHYSGKMNRTPTSPSPGRSATLPEYRRLEAKLQLSIRTKVAQNALLPNADLWFGFTQVSLWQLWSGSLSAPFRSTDYEPELIYMVPVPERWRALPWGWRWRYGQLAVAHQSNGQTIPLSRSWNRTYFGTGFDRGEVGIQLRVWRRHAEEPEDDDNPDLTAFRGRGGTRRLFG